MQRDDSTAPGDLTVVPALYEHAQNVYNEMLVHATPSDEGLMIYEGHLTQLFRKLRLSTPYYTQIKNQLTGMGCIEQIRRGGGSAESRWVLWKEPTLEEWKAATATRARRGNKTSMLERQIRDLTDRMSVLERQVDSLIKEAA